MVAAKGPTPKTAMYTVCCTMESIWGLRALCPCRDKDAILFCHGDCMGPTVRCMGVSICASPFCTLAHAHPNALDANWQLKFGAPLQSHWATTTPCTTNVLLSALSNVLPFVHSWGSFTVGDGLDGTGLSLRIPSPRRAHIRDFSGASRFSEDPMGCSYVSAVGHVYFIAPTTIPWGHCFRPLSMAP